MTSSAIYDFVEAVEEQITDLHSFVLLRHGVVVAEGGWSPYAPTYPHMLYSLSKSFTSTAIGMAVAEGRLTVTDRVLSFFPDEAPSEVSANLDAMQVHHLLSMSTGHAEDTTDYMRARPDGRWIEEFLALPVVYEPGTHFLYNTGATYMLSAIVQKLTGITLLDYLQPRLFEPLGIKNPAWEMSPEGICTGGFGLAITTEDIAKFGQLYLQKGQFNGCQLVPETWVEQASSHQINNGDDVNSDWAQGYGYQFWRCRHGAYRGDGAFGQYCVIMPNQDAVLAITGGLGDMQPVLNLVWQHLLPAMSESAPIPEHAHDHEKLSKKLNSLAYLPPQGPQTSSFAPQVSGKSFLMAPNVPGVTSMSFDFATADATLTLRTEHGTQQIACGLSAWCEGDLALFPYSARVVASGIWQDEQTFVMTLRYVETPYVHTLSCHFADERISVEGSINVSFGATTYSLTGKLDR
jgi:CubicO group peptidase (beta-lactamase class C family)